MATNVENQADKDLAAFRLAGSMTGLAVEKILGIPLARFCRPANLACIGLSVFTPEFTLVKAANLELEAQKALDACDPDDLSQLNIQPEKFKEQFIDLLGRENYSQGKIAQAIMRLADNGNKAQVDALRRSFAILMSCDLKLMPDFMPEPNVWFDGNYVCLAGVEQAIDISKQPKLMLEYGPGIAGSRRIPGEVNQITRSILIEKNPYSAHVLKYLASLYDIEEPRLTVMNIGIGSATEELLGTDLKGQIDVIVASMVYSAGIEELTKGIQNGKRLLRKGGKFVVLAPFEVRSGEMPGMDMLMASRREFGDEEYLHPFTFTTMASRKDTRAYYAIYQK
jgi:hypothetical protein